jgi:dolichol-phosphate mannosyltransferase
MIYILLPAYNEEDALRPLVEKIDRAMRELGVLYRVVVVDDGSRDATAEIGQELSADYPVNVITHRYNRGLGETIRDGLEYIA